MIAELYPQAGQHLTAARDAKVKMARTWGSYLDAGLNHVEVFNYPNGRGRITVHANWPTSARETLTNLFKVCTSELWACLDSLVSESVAMFSILKRPHAPERPRFFPIADSEDGLKALLEESCLDGVLPKQFQMILDCQPFRSVPDDDAVERFRIGLRQPLDWTIRLEDGSQVGAWVTPIEPQLRVPPPAELVHLEALAPGRLDTEIDVARYVLANYPHQDNVSSNAGSYVDLAFPDGFNPANAEDTFDRRLNVTIDVVERFVISFAWLADTTPSSKRVRTSSDQPTPSMWVEAGQSSRRWSDAELTALKRSDLGVGIVSETRQLTLLVATANGVYERVIPDASPLSSHTKRGIAAESAARDAAATWGLPDFVMRPRVERTGSGVREISDGLLLVGERGLIVQVKSRDANPGTPARESSWLTKKIAEGARQADGTARRLSSKTTDMMNGRGRIIAISGRNVGWTGVVIIDHPSPPGDYHLQNPPSRIPIVVLLRRDWEFLFNQLRSTRAVIDYLNRVEGSAPRLGGEPERYYELAAADADAAPGEIDPAAFGGGVLRSVPLLPAAPAGSDDDKAHGMVRIMCEDIATTHLDDRSETGRLQVLAAIDRLPVGHRTELGRFLLDGLHAARLADPEVLSWKLRTFRPTRDEPQLSFGICSKFTELTRQTFISWLLFRHHERGDFQAIPDAVSIGVLLTPRGDGLREWDTTMAAVTGDPQLTEEELQRSRELWNTER
jgi:hypothetical protein